MTTGYVTAWLIILVGLGVVFAFLVLVGAVLHRMSHDAQTRRRDIEAMPDDDVPPDDDAPVVVFRSSAGFEADLLRNVLVENGIPAVVDGGHTNNVLGGVALFESTLSVPASHADDARRLIADARTRDAGP